MTFTYVKNSVIQLIVICIACFCALIISGCATKKLTDNNTQNDADVGSIDPLSDPYEEISKLRLAAIDKSTDTAKEVERVHKKIQADIDKARHIAIKFEKTMREYYYQYNNRKSDKEIYVEVTKYKHEMEKIELKILQELNNPALSIKARLHFKRVKQEIDRITNFVIYGVMGFMPFVSNTND
jgi:hypothetical protein